MFLRFRPLRTRAVFKSSKKRRKLRKANRHRGLAAPKGVAQAGAQEQPRLVDLKLGMVGQVGRVPRFDPRRQVLYSYCLR